MRERILEWQIRVSTDAELARFIERLRLELARRERGG